MNDSELVAEIVALREEARDKFHGWRMRAIIELLEKAGTDLPARDRAVLLEQALQLRDEGSQNVWFRVRLQRRRAVYLVIMLALTLLALLAILVRFPGTSDESTAGPYTTLRIFLFGLLGGTLSALRPLGGRMSGRRIPEEVLSGAAVLIRPLIGGAAALAISTFLASGLLNLGTPSPALVLAVSFAAGFSERLVAKTVESVAGGDSGKEKNPE